MFTGVEPLRDIHGIQGVPWWPPGPGWWVLAAVLAVLLFLAFRFRAKLRLRVPPLPFFTLGSWRADAARHLRDLRRRARTQDVKATAAELSELLRRIAMARLGRNACAGLTGLAWLEWLAGNDPKGFDWIQEGRLLLEVPYAPPFTFPDTLPDAGRAQALIGLIDAAYDWVEVEDSKRHV